MVDMVDLDDALRFITGRNPSKKMKKRQKDKIEKYFEGKL